MGFRNKLLMASTALAMTVSTTVLADEFRIDRLFVVGDSLSDGGAYSQAIRVGGAQQGQTLLDIPYRFTNNRADGSSRTYAEVVAARLGIGLEPNVITGVPATAGTPLAGFANDVEVGGTNFAQGGARVALPNDDAAQLAGGIVQLPSTAQVDRLLAQNPSFDSNDLVIYWVGANDVSTSAESVAAAGQAAAIAATQAGQTPAQIQAAVDAAVQQATADAGQAVGTAAAQAVVQVERLIAAGATNLVVVTVPDIGTGTPAGREAGANGAALLSGLTTAYNNTLVGGLGGRATIVDAGAVLNDVLADPTRYGFSDVDHLDINNTQCVTASAVQCIDGATTRPGTFIFADDRHLTNQANLTLGEMAYSALVAIGQTGAIPVAIISGLRQQSLGLEQRLNLGAFFIDDGTGNRIRRPVGNVEIYGGGEVGFYESDPQQVVPGFDATTQVVKLAADVMVHPNVMVGIGGTVDHGQIDFEGNRGGFDSRLYVGGIFGVAQIMPGIYANGFLGGGLIDVYDIDRSFTTTNFETGKVESRNNYNADTDGTYFIARTNVGGVLPVGNGFFVNPSIGFAYERVDIDGYSEEARGDAPGSLAATVGDLEYEGYRGTVALGGFYRPPSLPGWTFGLRASWEHDFNDDDVKVPFAVGNTPLNVQTAPRPDDSYGLLSATVVKELSHTTSANLQASTNFGQDGVTGYTLGLVFKHTF